MSNLSASFASLVKYNNGFFKSEKQAKYLLDNCLDGLFISGGDVYGNSYRFEYYCDSKGIDLVRKYYSTTNKVEVLFKRGELNVSLDKEIKRSIAQIADSKQSLIALDKQEAEEIERFKAKMSEMVRNIKAMLDTGVIPASTITLYVKGCNQPSLYPYDYSNDRQRRLDWIEKKEAFLKQYN